MSVEQVRFEIPGEPIAKGRPRATAIGGRGRLYTPAKTERYESKVALFARDAMRGGQPMSAPLRVQIVAHMQIPASWSKRRQAEAAADRIKPAKRPDADNLAKSVTDGCNGIVWRDDSLIVDLHVSKRYSGTPHVAVMVHALNGTAE